MKPLIFFPPSSELKLVFERVGGGEWGGGGAVWYISSLGSIFVYVTTIENCIKAWSVFIKARD